MWIDSVYEPRAACISICDDVTNTRDTHKVQMSPWQLLCYDVTDACVCAESPNAENKTSRLTCECVLSIWSVCQTPARQLKHAIYAMTVGKERLLGNMQCICQTIYV